MSRTAHLVTTNKSTKIVEDEETTLDMLQRGIFDHEHPHKVQWDVIVGGFIMLSVIITPFRLGFFIPDEGLWLLYDWIVDTVFFVDIVINFRTTYLDHHTMTHVTVPSMIASHYLRGWFFIDLVSTLPFRYLAKSTTLEEATNGLGVLKMFKALRLLRVLKVCSTLNELPSPLVHISTLLLTRACWFIARTEQARSNLHSPTVPRFCV